MEFFKSLLHLLLVLLCVCVDPTNAQEVSTCTFHDSLCEITHSALPMPSNKYSIPTDDYSTSICTCPGPVSCGDSDRFITLDLPLPEERIIATLDYCYGFANPTRICNKTEIAVTMRGHDQVPTEIVEDVKCQCYEFLVLVKTMPEPDEYNYRKFFTCGKPTCDACKSDPPACERVTTTETGSGQVTELPCRCPYGYSCARDPSQLPVTQGEVEFYCQPTLGTEKK